MRFVVIGAWTVFVLVSTSVHAQDDALYKPYTIISSSPPRDAIQSLSQIRIPAGLKIDLYAAELLLSNPVCFWIDEHNRIYVAETDRVNRGVEDDRGHTNWLADDMAARTVADRVAMFKKYEGERIKRYTSNEDRIRLLEDTDGKG